MRRGNLRLSVRAAAVAAFAVPAFVLNTPAAMAHPDAPPAPHDLWHAEMWRPEPVALGLIAFVATAYGAGVYRVRRRSNGRGVDSRRVAAMAGGVLALAAALLSPIDTLAAALLSVHMLQHLLLVLVAAPLIVLAAPLAPFLWALARPARLQLARLARAPALRAGGRMLTVLPVAWLLHAGALWLWHLPGPYQAALRSDAAHAAEHATFLGTALIFWWAVIRGGAKAPLRYGSAIIAVFLMAFQGGALGAIMTFARTPWYPDYAPGEAAWGIDPLADQRVAGLIMWMPAGVIYALIAVLLLRAWLRAVEREVERQEARPAGRDPALPVSISSRLVRGEEV